MDERGRVSQSSQSQSRRHDDDADDDDDKDASDLEHETRFSAARPFCAGGLRCWPDKRASS
jgi:hypothetical protein